MTWLSANFKLSELTTTSTGLDNTPNQAEIANLRRLAVLLLQPLRDAVGPVIVNSGFRSERVNRAVGGTASSQHRSGQAADVWVRGYDSRALARKVIELGLPFDQLIFYPGTARIHLSYGPRHRQQVLCYANGNYRQERP